MRLIDADALQQAHDKQCDGDCNFCRWSSNDNDWRCGLVDDQPTVDPVKHGHWKPSNQHFGNVFLIECSVCGKPRMANTIAGIPKRPECNYCYGCGCRYDEPDEVEWYRRDE